MKTVLTYVAGVATPFVVMAALIFLSVLKDRRARRTKV